MSKVFFFVGISLDGFMAPEGMDMEHGHDPNYKDWGNQWSKLQAWIFQQKFFRENLKLGEGGETGRDNQLLEQVFAVFAAEYRSQESGFRSQNALLVLQPGQYFCS